MTVAKLDELTDGSAKIFGMENFGNTCYCNSILQCLYYIKPFREQVLGFPEGVRPNQKRRTAVPGKTPHPFTVDPSGAKISTSISQQEMNVVNSAVTGGGASSSAHSPVAGADSAAPKSKVSRRMSLFKTKTRDIPETKDAQSGTIDDDGVSSPLGANTGNSAAVSSALPASATADRKTPLPVGLQGIQTGIKLPGQNMSVVGFNEDVFSTSDQKKRAALVRGPILNIDLSFADEYKMPESLFTALKDIFESMAQCSSRVGVVSPNNLINVLKKENELFRSSMHQDAHEFLNFLLNEVIESVDRQSGNNPKWVHDLFEGQLTSETRCLTCENVSRRDEKFLDLSIDLDRNSSVTSCLRQFSASETLCERNKFHCDKCGGLQEAQKRMKVKRLPKILALHLKRFKFTEDMQRNVKLFHKVLYPKHLRLFNTTYDAPNPDKLYELTSVVVHIGGGPYHGHYVSVVKTEHAGWLLFDDEMVESVDDDYVFNFFGNNKGMASAYVLFYQEVPESDVALMPNSEYSASSATEFTVNTVEDDLSSDAESATELNSQTPSLHIQANTTATAATSTTVGSAGSPPTVAVPAYADSITPPKVRNGASSKDKKRGLSFSFKMK